jgi:hypothetical protein
VTAPGCPDPATCPVPDPTPARLRSLHTHVLEAGTTFFTAYRTAHPDLFNASGHGSTRFAPVTDATGSNVPTIYGSASQTAALLETVFHDVHASVRPRLITSMALRERGLLRLTLPHRIVLFDLRDEALARMGLLRHQLTTTTAAHYVCTREWASSLLNRGVGRARPVGIVWHSRVAELARLESPLFGDLLRGPTTEVFVLFGGDIALDRAGRVLIGRAVYAPAVISPDLTTPAALPLVAAISRELDAILV